MSGHNDAEVARFCDWCFGREADPTHGQAARYIRAWVKTRPSVGTQARWPSFSAMHAHARFMDPNVTANQLDAAIAAFRAS